MPNQQPLYPLKIASIYHWRQHSVPVLRVKKNIKKRHDILHKIDPTYIGITK